ncbi:prolyl oligopeptidase family serine peptidase [Pendulispora brunnea]|uniref:prolyl oligopeptidase n=1 Tax=Pendulispora brunnea TaxID=2905690 RepID=A0ABZ2K761_9BACT
MENTDRFSSFEVATPEMTKWEQEQSRSALEYLHGRRNFDEVLQRVRQYRNEAQPPREVEVRGHVTFSLEERKGTQGMSILRRDAKSAPSVLFRIGDDEASRRVQIDFMSVSPSGRFVAIGTSDAGAEETIVRVLDARTGKDHGDRAYDVRSGCFVWLPDESGYLYMRGRGRKGVPLKDQIRDLSVAVHTLGKPAEQDAEVVGSQARGERIHGEYEYPYPSISPNGQDIVIAVKHSLNPDLTVFTKKRNALLNEKVDWTRIYDQPDRVKATAVADGRVLVVRGIDDEHDVLEQVSTGNPSARRVLYTANHTLENLVSAGQDTYVVEREIATKHLVLVRSTSEVIPIALPTGRSVFSDNLRLDRTTNTLVVDLRAWTEPRSWWTLAPNKRAVEPIRSMISASHSDAFEVRSMEASARDGQRIPLTVVGLKGQASSPPKYVWISGYGCYGAVLGPSFTAARRIFIESGGTYIFAHIRGGGEKGRTWHQQARGATKIKTVEDFIDSVKFVRGAGFGTGGGIFVSGGSAGALPVGGLFVRNPELIDAAYIEGGVLNVSRMEAGSATGPLHKDEYGTNDTPEGARRLRDLDAYLNVQDGQSYPPILLRAGLNDPRVPRWQSSKFAARVQQATSAAHPVLFRMTGGGHIGGTTVDEEAQVEAEIVTFALSNIRHPDFQ